MICLFAINHFDSVFQHYVHISVQRRHYSCIKKSYQSIVSPSWALRVPSCQLLAAKMPGAPWKNREANNKKWRASISKNLPLFNGGQCFVSAKLLIFYCRRTDNNSLRWFPPVSELTLSYKDWPNRCWYSSLTNAISLGSRQRMISLLSILSLHPNPRMASSSLRAINCG